MKYFVLTLFVISAFYSASAVNAMTELPRIVLPINAQAPFDIVPPTPGSTPGPISVP